MAEPEQIVEPCETARMQLPILETSNPSIHSSTRSGVESAAGDISSANPLTSPRSPTASPEAAAKETSMLLYWLLLGFSALILIIQIWIYFS
jgi:hypothetical protein